MVCEVVVGIFIISVCIQTALHLLKASVVDVDDIWGKRDRYAPPMGYVG
jgi:hypothetical protein